MDRRSALAMMGGLVLCPLCGASSFSADAHWSYEGATGPDKWGGVDPGNAACGLGGQQSPLDIGTTIKAQLSPLQMSWAKQGDTIVNNGHTIQVNFAPGSTLTRGTEKYTLVQFHLHRPSEHLVGGKSFAMEVHFVHRDDAGTLAVVGVLMTTGGRNAVFSKLIATMPTVENTQAKADANIDPNGLLPTQLAYYYYEGSLTTPPCSETVNWLLLTDPIQVADADVASFAKLYPMNARPVQKSNRRFILQSS